MSLATLLLVFFASFTPIDSARQTPPSAQQAPSPLAEELWAAARAGDVARVTAALDKGVDVNVKTRYGATALTYAADKGHLELVKFLISRGADVNAQDTFYQMRAIDMAMMNDHAPVVSLLLERGSKGSPTVLAIAIQRGNVPLVTKALASTDLTRANVQQALLGAKKTNNAEIIALVEKKLASMPADPPPAVTVDAATLKSYAGAYRNDGGATLTIAYDGTKLMATPPGGQPIALAAVSQTAFRPDGMEGLTVEFSGRGGMIERAVVTQGNSVQVWGRVAEGAPAASPPPSAPAAALPTPAAPPAAPPKPAARTAPRNWPGFRGENASGIGDGQGAPVEWDVDTKQNVAWKTPIPGMSIASPIVWGIESSS